jgi:hypothetical protein
MHEEFARTVFDKVCCYVAQPRGTMDRGSAKLEDLIHRIRFSQYNPEVDLDEAMCGAMPVKADRISVLERAGILNPCDHLSPEQLREFKAMPKDIPIPGPAPGDCRALSGQLFCASSMMLT